jgi:O-antigen/teichoic acid export membrane protein
VLNTAVSMLGRVLYMAGWLVLAPYMVARLGMERFGFWSVLSLVSGFFLTFDLGLSQSLARFIAEHRARDQVADRRGVLTAGTALYLGVGVAWAVALIGGRSFALDFFHVAAVHRGEMSAAFVAAAVTAVVLCAYTVSGSVLTGLQRFDLWNLISIVVTLLQQVLTAVALARGVGLAGITWWQGGVTLAGTLVAAVVARRLDPDLGFSWAAATRTVWARLTRYSAALQVVNLGVLAQFQMPKLLLGRMMGLAEVGRYELGYRIGFTAWTVPSLLVPPLVPVFAHLEAAGERDRVLRLYQLASRYLMIASMTAGAGLIAFGPLLLRAWMGEGPGPAARTAMAFGLLIMVNFLTTPGSTIVRSIGEPWLEARYQVLAVVLQLGFGLWWIPRFGYDGALAALITAITVGSAYFLYLFHRRFDWPFAPWVRATVLPPLLAAALGAAAGHWVSAALAGEAPARSRALLALLAGGSTQVLLTAGTLIAGGFLSVSELRGLLDQARRPAAR